MKKELLANVIFRNVRNTLGTAAFALALIVGAAQAQSAPIPANAVKQTTSETQSETKIDAVLEQKKENSISTISQPEVQTDGAPASQTGPINDRLSSSSSENVNSHKQSSLISGWDVSFDPYLYITGMKGTVGARGRSVEIDVGFSDVIENLDLGLMGALEARKGRFVLVSDLVWIKLGEERETPGELFSSVKLGVNMVIWDPEVGYRVYESKGGSFDVLGGVRLMSVETNVNFREGALPAFDVSERKTWATPVVGARGILNLSPKFFLATKFDVGGGIGADFTGQFYGGGGYRITPKIALIGGYRYMKTDYDSDAGFLFDTDMNGIIVGAKFTF